MIYITLKNILTLIEGHFTYPAIAVNLECELYWWTRGMYMIFVSKLLASTDLFICTIGMPYFSVKQEQLIYLICFYVSPTICKNLPIHQGTFFFYSVMFLLNTLQNITFIRKNKYIGYQLVIVLYISSHCIGHHQSRYWRRRISRVYCIDVIMGAIASQITSLASVYSAV